MGNPKENWPPAGGFAERMMARDTFFMSDVAKEVELLTTEHLDFVIMMLVANRMMRYQEPDEVFVRYSLATEMLRFFLGNDWTNENVFGCHPTVSHRNRAGRTFLKSELLDSDKNSAFRHQNRVVSIAECLFNLQGVSGIKHRIAQLMSDNLEAALGELECARLIAHPDFNLRFVIPIGQKGRDYDAEIKTTDGSIVCGEIKTKKETEDYAETTVWNTLDHARRQLPKGCPGIIFAKLPELWVKKTEFEKVVKDAIDKTFRQSQRLVAVVLAWEEWVTMVEGQAALSMFSINLNSRSKLLTTPLERALQEIGNRNNVAWVNLQDYVRERLPMLTRFVFERLFIEYAAPGQHLAEQGYPEPLETEMERPPTADSGPSADVRAERS